MEKNTDSRQVDPFVMLNEECILEIFSFIMDQPRPTFDQKELKEFEPIPKTHERKTEDGNDEGTGDKGTSSDQAGQL